jgi:recombination protein RecR
MNYYPQPLQKLIREFGRMPGIGQKSAERLAHHILRLPYDDAMQLALAVRDVKKGIKYCSICCNIGEIDPCTICLNKNRDQHKVCVVEQPKDLYTIEKSGFYNGLYHVLFGHINPLENVNSDDINVDRLVKRVKERGVSEVIIATNPNLEGDVTAFHILECLEPLGIKVSQLARGIPSGSYLEYANSAIIAEAMNGRRLMQKNSSDFIKR